MLLAKKNNFNLWDEMFGRPFWDTTFDNNITANGIMKTDIKEDENGYELAVEVPGYKKEDIQAELNDGYLTITASTSMENNEQDENGHYIRRERYQGTSKRSFFVGEEVTQSDIKASFTDGVLKLNIPKLEPTKEEDKPKLIEIQ